MISERLKQVILRELHLENFDFQDQTKAFEVPGWDSLRHVSILAAVEQEYGVRLRTLEVLRLKDVGELQALVDRKVQSPPS